MSKFLSFYNLFPIPDPKEFLGLASDREKGNVVTTLARNVVVVLNISTQKQLLSWSLPEKLSTKVIYDPSSQHYVGVFGNHSLRLWDVGTADVSKCKKLKFQKSIAHLVETDQEALVLYSDGVCQTLSQALASRKDQKEDTAEQLALAASKTLSKPTVYTMPQGQQVLTYFEETKATGVLQLIRLSLATSTRCEYTIERESVRLTGYAVVEGDTAPQMLTVWSDKRIFMLNLAERTSERSPGQYVSMLADLNVEKKLSVHGVSRNFAAIYGANYGQEGASLLVYNTQFKVVNAKQYFKMYLEFSRLWARDEHILLAMGQNIAAVRYRMSSEILVDMLGSQSSDTQLNTIELDHINEEDTLESAIKFAGSKKHRQSYGKIQANLKMLPLLEMSEADGRKVAYDPPELFEEEMSELIKQHIHGELIECENGLDDVSVTLMTNYFDEGPMNTAVQALVRQLERSGAGEEEIIEKILTLFIKTKNSEHVLMCLRRYSNISEKMLAWSLRYALDNTPNSTRINGHSTEEPMETDQTNDELLNAVLACSFDPTAIEPHLRERLQISHVQYLLNHLYVLASEPSAQLEERPNREASLVQTESQALQWFGTLLTSHFTVLTISKDEQVLETLTKWSDLLAFYRDSLIDMAALLPQLTKIVEMRETRSMYSTAWYGIEEVVLY
ncbi:nucleolar protein 11 [Drosophila guanche]|uniref:Blast:Nucleolar protein 11 n=1 Tax=Drosophila guanche TaxID=7266 RepID=A0A3B0JMC4_DROGU|nr:nucleolar protein 11 [Drosophila guanche]SPP76600.1 blast:Nucleolar protein 11 [Drosophila guanche]